MPSPTQNNAEAAAANIRDDFGVIFTTTRPIQENRTNVPYHIWPVAFKSHD